MIINARDLKAEINELLTCQYLSYMQQIMLLKAVESNSIDDMYRVIEQVEEGVGK